MVSSSGARQSNTVLYCIRETISSVIVRLGRCDCWMVNGVQQPTGPTLGHHSQAALKDIGKAGHFSRLLSFSTWRTTNVTLNKIVNSISNTAGVHFRDSLSYFGLEIPYAIYFLPYYALPLRDNMKREGECRVESSSTHKLP